MLTLLCLDRNSLIAFSCFWSDYVNLTLSLFHYQHHSVKLFLSLSAECISVSLGFDKCFGDCCTWNDWFQLKTRGFCGSGCTVVVHQVWGRCFDSWLLLSDQQLCGCSTVSVWLWELTLKSALSNNKVESDSAACEAFRDRTEWRWTCAVWTWTVQGEC